MASRKGYTSLPPDSGGSAEQPPGAAAAAGGTEHSSAGERRDGASGRDAAGDSANKKGASEAKIAGESAGKDGAADPTGGLPVAEGVFVGDPISQSTYDPSAPQQATVITSAPTAAYQNHVVAAAAAAAATGGDGRGIAMPHQGGGQHTVIVMNAPPGGQNQFGEWGREPQPFVCRACGFSGLTATMTDPCSNMPILAAACCCLIGLWACSFVPFLIPELRDTVHRCPNCQMAVGRSRQFR